MFKRTLEFQFLLRTSVFSGAILIPATPHCQPSASISGTSNTAKLARIKDQMERELSFHGKVLDQYNVPVEGAKVGITIRRLNLGPSIVSSVEKSATTDKDGDFTVAGEQGFELIVGKIEKDGYEPTFAREPKQSFRTGDEVVPFPDIAHPILYQLRKRGETAVLHKNPNFNIQVDARQLVKDATGTSRVVGYDLIRGTTAKNLNSLMLNGEPIVCDLMLGVSTDESKTSWTVIITPGDPSGGILASDELLYEAPLDGYKREVSFVAEDHKPPKARFLYLRSRNPNIFTRIEIMSCNANANFFRLNGKQMTNPFGDRILDDDQNIPAAVRVQILNDVTMAYHKNQRPSKPDLKKLIEAYKASSLTQK